MYSFDSRTVAVVGMEAVGNFSAVRVFPYVPELLPTLSHFWPTPKDWMVSWLVVGCCEESVVSVTPPAVPWTSFIVRPGLGTPTTRVGDPMTEPSSVFTAIW